MPAWPASLPQRPLADGFRETPPDLIVRSQTDLGSPRVRRRATAGVTRVALAFRFSRTQLATFRTFLHADLQDRALAFQWTHPITGVAGSWRIAEAPVIEPIAGGTAWRVSMSWELLP
ncbi:MAG: hypothetical protein P9C48_14435 [Defluviicoccus sp.]|nr:hypothetical protein [Defluviicoccus sp.]MDG4610317.1 hypothetical protein [Defluviicoccus sp.]